MLRSPPRHSLLWRVSGLTLAVSGSAFSTLFEWFNWLDKLTDFYSFKNGWRDLDKEALFSFLFSIILIFASLYFSVRFFLVVECFISLTYSRFCLKFQAGLNIFRTSYSRVEYHDRYHLLTIYRQGSYLLTLFQLSVTLWLTVSVACTPLIAYTFLMYI